MVFALVIALLLGAAVAAEPVPYRIAVTVDDVPWMGPVHPDGKLVANRAILAALQAHGAPATAFVNCDLALAGAPVLRAWLDAGMELGNHQAAHDDLNKVPEARWLEGVRRCDAVLREITGQAVVYFRYPYLFNGPSPEVRDRVLGVLTGDLGYTIARVSVDNHEWKIANLYGQAVAAGDREQAGELAKFYVEHVLSGIENFRAVAQRKVGRDVAHVLLLHANGLNADHLNDLLTALEGDGASFIPLSEALQDPVYALPQAYEGRWGLSWLYRVEPVDHERPWDDQSWRELQVRFGEVD